MAQIVTTPVAQNKIAMSTSRGIVNTTGNFQEGTLRQACSPTGGGIATGIDPETGKNKTIAADILQDGTRNIVTNLGDGRQVRNAFDQTGLQLSGIRVNADGTKVDLMKNEIPVTASNNDGDTLTLNKPEILQNQGTCNSSDTLTLNQNKPCNKPEIPQAERQNIYGKFSLSMDKVKNILNLSDGVVPGKEYTNFPQRLGSKDVQWNAGVTENLKDSNPKVSPTGSYVRTGKKDNAIDSQESSLMAQQMSYAAEQEPQQGMVSPKTAISSRNFLQSLYNGNSFRSFDGTGAGSMSPGIDTDGDGVFTLADAQALEMKDQQQGLSSRDFDIATSEYVNNGGN